MFQNKKARIFSGDYVTKINAYSLIGFILGILVVITALFAAFSSPLGSFAVILFWFWFAAFLTSLACDIIGLIKIKRDPEVWRGALLSILGILIILLWIAFLLSMA